MRHVRTLEHGADFLVDGETADAEVLTKAVFHEQQRHADQRNHDDVGDEESTCKLAMKLTIGYCQHKSSNMKGKMAAFCELVKSV